MRPYVIEAVACGSSLQAGLKRGVFGALVDAFQVAQIPSKREALNRCTVDVFWYLDLYIIGTLLQRLPQCQASVQAHLQQV